MKSKLMVFLLISIVLLYWSDLFNFIFSGTLLVSWKQIIAFLYWGLALKYARDEWHHILLLFSMISGLLLSFNSFFFYDVGFETVLFNFFLYYTWPAMLVLLSIGLGDYLQRKKFWPIWFFLVLGSAVGLQLDLYTDFFSFLPRNVMDSAYFILQGEAKRASFFFPASTMAIPLIASMGILALRATNNSRWVCWFTGLTLPVAAMATGSVSSYVVAVVCMVLFFLEAKEKIAGSVIAIALSIAGVMSINMADSEIFSKQFDRIMNNTSANSISNMERQLYWEQAHRVISDFNIIDHVVGKGLGATFPKLDTKPRYSHGESSFFQSHIEAGLVGDFSRLLPFLLIFFFSVRHKNLICLGWGVTTLIAITLAPTAGSIPYQVMLAIAIYLSMISFKVKDGGNELRKKWII